MVRCSPPMSLAGYGSTPLLGPGHRLAVLRWSRSARLPVPRPLFGRGRWSDMSGMDDGRSATESAGARQPVKAASVNSSLRPPTGGAVTSTSATNIRLGAAALAVAGVLFLAYPSVRPWHDESTATGASASMGSNAWVAAHFFAMVGFVLLPLGLLALQAAVAATPAAPTARLATVVAWVGCGLTLP